MNYIKMLNGFYQYVQHHDVPAQAQLVYLHMLLRNNELLWNEWFSFSVRRIMALTRIGSPNTVRDAISFLLNAGMIEAAKKEKSTTKFRLLSPDNYDTATGKIEKKQPNNINCNDNDTVTRTVSASVSESVSESVSDTIQFTGSYNKIINKNKNRNENSNHPFNIQSTSIITEEPNHSNAFNKNSEGRLDGWISKTITDEDYYTLSNTDAFKVFMLYYPRNQGKLKDVQAAWLEATIDLNVLPGDLIFAAMNYATECRNINKNPDYIKMRQNFIRTNEWKKYIPKYLPSCPKCHGKGTYIDTNAEYVMCNCNLRYDDTRLSR